MDRMENRAEREAKFDKIYRAYESEVFRTAKYYLKDDYAARDVMQDTFCHFYGRMEDISNTGVKAYLMATSRNLAKNYKRDSSHEVQSENIEELAMYVEIPLESAEEQFFREEQKKKDIEFGKDIFDALYKKNQTWYHIMYLLLKMDMDYEEISERLKIPKQILYNKVFRAKAWMVKTYKEKLQDIEA